MIGGTLRWRKHVCLLFFIVVGTFIIFYIDVFQMTTLKTSLFTLPQHRFVEQPNLLSKDYLIKTEGCRIPYMDPFDPSVLKYIKKEKAVVCNQNMPPLIFSNLTSLFLLNTSLEAYNITNVRDLDCCYSVMNRVVPTLEGSDNQLEYDKCIKFNKTVKIGEEFVRVMCSYKNDDIYKDFFSFVPIKTSFNPNLIKNNRRPLNVLIIGLDAVSRTNLHRQMPKTIQTLTEMGAVEFLGYTKVGDNTYPNAVPLLSGLSTGELEEKCLPKKNNKFDNCSFIWNNFSKQGYATAFGEDSAWMGIFNYAKNGFQFQPTDYYWGPFEYVAENEIGNEHRMNVKQCIGSREVYKVLLEYIMKFAISMHQYKSPYFGFFWGASLSHDFLNKPKLGDEYYAKFFRSLRTNELLSDTVLLFISDHGIRWGGIRHTYQGRMEERLPFLFMILPKEWQKNYYTAFDNLKQNSERLTSPFDLHETLKDLLNPYSLTQEFLSARGKTRHDTKTAYSLFDVIPTNRTCLLAGIYSHWCTCQESAEIDKRNSIVQETVHFAIDHINNNLDGYAECAKLTLAKIYSAHEHAFKNNELGNNTIYSLDYTIVFETMPGNAIFEATVRKHVNKEKNKNYFTVTGTISRINLYRSQSSCMTDYHLKLYCYCI